MISPLWPVPVSGALTGLRVVDLSQQLPGPYSTFLLAELGASVIKVEPPGGDLARRVDAAMYEQLNAAKRVIELDLKSHAGRDTLRQLVIEAGAVLEASRPGVVQRLGADPETLSGLNPHLIYCSLTGYGQRGPLASRGAHDLNIQAAIGALDQIGDGMDRVGVAWADLAAGMMAALAVTAAWHGGQAGLIDLGMLDVAASWATLKPGALTDREPVYGTVTSRDGQRFAIAVLEDPVWQRLCVALGWTDWVDDSHFESPRDRRAHGPEIRARLDATIAGLDAARVDELARSADLPLTAFAPAAPAATEQLTMRGFGGGPRFHVPVPVPWSSALEPVTIAEAYAPVATSPRNYVATFEAGIGEVSIEVE